MYNFELAFLLMHLYGTCFVCRCLKTINSKKYGVDLVCFTPHPTTVIYSSKNGWDGMFIATYGFSCGLLNLFEVVYECFIYPESLRLLSLHDNKYLRYFKGHHDRLVF